MVSAGFIRRAITFAAATLVAASSISAQAIRYSFTGVGSGVYNNNPFTNQNFSFIMDGDISNVAHPNTAYFSTGLTANFSIDNVVSGFMFPVYVFSQHEPNSVSIGFGGNPSGDILSLFGPTFVGNTYDLKSAYGPVTLVPPVIDVHFTNRESSVGPITMNNVSSLTFQATTDVSVVPEPSTFALMGAGFVIVGIVARRKRVNA